MQEISILIEPTDGGKWSIRKKISSDFLDLLYQQSQLYHASYLALEDLKRLKTLLGSITFRSASDS